MSDGGGNTRSRQGTTDTTIASTPPSRTPTPTALPKLSDQKQEKVPAGFKEPCRPKPPTSECLDRNYRVIAGLCFQNMTDAKSSMELAQWRAPGNDSTIPQSDEEHRQVVRLLVNAFKDMSIAKDTPDNAYRKRLTPGTNVYYSDWAIEACAWDIVRMVKDIHTEGFKAPIYDRTVIDSISQTQKWNFMERIDWICVVLKTSKNVAVTLMKHEKTSTIIGAPHRLYSSTLTNSISNAHRGVWVKNGRQADATHQGRVSKRQKTSNSASNDYGSNTNNAMNQSSDIIASVPKQRKAAKSKYIITTPFSHNKYGDPAVGDPPPYSSTIIDTSANVHVPSSKSLTSSSVQQGTDADIVVLMFGELCKNNDTASAPPVVPGSAETSVSKREPLAAGNEMNDDVITKDTTSHGQFGPSHKEKTKTTYGSYSKRINYHSKPAVKNEFPTSDSSSELSDAPSTPDASSTLSDVCPDSSKVSLRVKGMMSSLKPPTHDAALLEAAKSLTSIYNAR